MFNWFRPKPSQENSLNLPASPSGHIEPLGRVSCPSGKLLILDGGLAWMWSHDRPPLLPEWMKEAEQSNTAVDLVIQGPDARAAGVAFDRSSHPLYLYDRPRAGLDKLSELFQECLRNHALNARLESLPRRIPHRERVDWILQDGRGLGVVDFHGVWAVAVGGCPAGSMMAVMGERIPEGPDKGRWRRVWFEVRGGKTANTRPIGHVAVDKARLMLVDADALGDWNDRTPLDGKADLVFWGRDAAAVAQRLNAPAIRFEGEPEMFGWADLPLDEAKERFERVQAARSDDTKFAVDLRPHTHHWQVMRTVRASPTESGTLEVGGAALCMLMTGWGDGAFPVEADFDAADQLLRVRLELGCDEIVQRQRKMEERWFGAFSKLAMVSAKVARDGAPIRFLYREEADRDPDSGWRVFAGNETEEYNDEPANIVLVPIRDLLGRDKQLEAIFRTPAPCAFERAEAAGPFLRVHGFSPRTD